MNRLLAINGMAPTEADDADASIPLVCSSTTLAVDAATANSCRVAAAEAAFRKMVAANPTVPVYGERSPTTVSTTVIDGGGSHHDKTAARAAAETEAEAAFQQMAAANPGARVIGGGGAVHTAESRATAAEAAFQQMAAASPSVRILDGPSDGSDRASRSRCGGGGNNASVAVRANPSDDDVIRITPAMLQADMMMGMPSSAVDTTGTIKVGSWTFSADMSAEELDNIKALVAMNGAPALDADESAAVSDGGAEAAFQRMVAANPGIRVVGEPSAETEAEAAFQRMVAANPGIRVVGEPSAETEAEAAFQKIVAANPGIAVYGEPSALTEAAVDGDAPRGTAGSGDRTVALGAGMSAGACAGAGANADGPMMPSALLRKEGKDAIRITPGMFWAAATDDSDGSVDGGGTNSGWVFSPHLSPDRLAQMQALVGLNGGLNGGGGGGGGGVMASAMEGGGSNADADAERVAGDAAFGEMVASNPQVSHAPSLCIPLQSTYPMRATRRIALHYIALHSTASHCILLRRAAIHCIPSHSLHWFVPSYVHSTEFHCIRHHIPQRPAHNHILRYSGALTTFNYVPLHLQHFTTFHCTYNISLRSTALTTFHYVPLRLTIFHCVPLHSQHFTTFHCTLQYSTVLLCSKSGSGCFAAFCCW
jgi:hypothetical protein